MSGHQYLHLGSVRDVETFRLCLRERGIHIPCDGELMTRNESPLAKSLSR